MSEIELKPCPFCGGKAGLYHTYDGRSCVQCDECGISTLRKMDARLAIQMWNKRDGEKTAEEQIAELNAENVKLRQLLEMAADTLEEKMQCLCEVTERESINSACVECAYSRCCDDNENCAENARWIYRNKVNELLREEQ